MTPADLHATTATSTSASLAWNAPAGSVDTYKVQYQVFNSGQWVEITVSGSNPAATVSGLARGTWYQFRVAACNASGCSAVSDALALSTYAA